MEQIEIWRRFNRIHRVCNQLAICDEAGGEAVFSRDDEALLVGDDADVLLAYVRSTKDTDFMLECCKIDRNRLNGRRATPDIRHSLFSCWGSLNEIHDLALKVVFGISNEDIKDCKYYINCVDGLCKDSETSSTIINPVEKEVNDLPSELKTDEALSYSVEFNENDLQQIKPKPNRGRPNGTFKDKMICDTDGSRLHKIHNAINGKTGKDVSLIILACIKKGWITKPTYTQVKNEFGDIGSKTGYNRYLNEQMFSREELEGAISILE